MQNIISFEYCVKLPVDNELSCKVKTSYSCLADNNIESDSNAKYILNKIKI